MATARNYTAYPLSDPSNIYSTPDARFPAAPRAGQPGTFGAYGNLPALPQMPGQAYPYQPVTITGTAPKKITSQTAQATKSFGDYMAQERQAGIQRNLDRRNVVLEGYNQQIANARGLLDQNAADMAGYGASAKQSLEDNYKRALGAAKSSANKRGLGNTTILNNMERGADADLYRGQIALNDQLMGQKQAQNLSGLDRENALAASRLGFLQSYSDEFPALSDVGNLYVQSASAEETAALAKAAAKAAAAPVGSQF